MVYNTIAELYISSIYLADVSRLFVIITLLNKNLPRPGLPKVERVLYSYRDVIDGIIDGFRSKIFQRKEVLEANSDIPQCRQHLEMDSAVTKIHNLCLV